MKIWIYLLLIVISAQAFVPGAAHADYEQSVAAEQSEQDTGLPIAGDGGVEHCCHCHGFSVISDITSAHTLPLAVRLSFVQPALPQPPDDPLLRPPIA